MSDVERCPYCGGKAALTDFGNEQYSRVECERDSCEAEGPKDYPEAAVAKWNRVARLETDNAKLKASLDAIALAVRDHLKGY